MGERGRRLHARIETELECTIGPIDGVDGSHVNGRLRDISLGGAFILTSSRSPLGLSDPCVIELQHPEGEVGRLQARVVRCETNDAEDRLGVQFMRVELTESDFLQRLIRTLTEGEGVGSRQHPRIYRRMAVTCRTAEDCNAMVANFSKGGVGLVSDQAFHLDEEVTVKIGIGEGTSALELSGTVTHVETKDDAYHVGLRFERPFPNGKAREVIQFIQRLMEQVVRED